MLHLNQLLYHLLRQTTTGKERVLDHPKFPNGWRYFTNESCTIPSEFCNDDTNEIAVDNFNTSKQLQQSWFKSKNYPAKYIELG